MFVMSISANPFYFISIKTWQINSYQFCMNLSVSLSN
jgi:hypothetical protein